MHACISSVSRNELIDFCDRCELSISDITITFTCVSDALGSTFWLDHAICSGDMRNIIIHVSIQDN